MTVCRTCGAEKPKYKRCRACYPETQDRGRKTAGMRHGMLKCRVCRERHPAETYRLTEQGNRSSRCEDCHMGGGVRHRHTLQCETCNDSFMGHPNARYCSDECRPKREEGRTKLWRDRRRNYRQAVESRGFVGSFERWAGQACPAARWANPAPVTIKIKPPKAKAERRFPDEFYELDVAGQFRWRYRNDPEFNLKQRLKASARKHARFGCINTRLRSSLRARAPRGSALFDLLGYTASDLREHLERQFSGSMTWDAFCDGDVHIDHVVPIAAHDLSDEDDVRRCWALPNLRPAWAEDNRRKAARVEFLL